MRHNGKVYEINHDGKDIWLEGDNHNIMFDGAMSDLIDQACDSAEEQDGYMSHDDGEYQFNVSAGFIQHYIRENIESHVNSLLASGKGEINDYDDDLDPAGGHGLHSHV